MRAALLSIWTVYDHPDDYPHGFVARRHEPQRDGTTVPTADVVFAPTLDAVRAKLPPELYRLEREPGDAPSIVESWI